MAVDVLRLAPVRGARAARVADREYGLLIELLGDLEPDEWSLPTDCAPWTVRQIAAHVLGATEAHAHPIEMLRQLRHGRRGIGVSVDLVNDLQVRDRDHLDPAELVARLTAARKPAVTSRRRVARLAGRIPFRAGAPIDETWSLGYLMNVIYTRDTWMHRVDVCRATGRVMDLSADHDGVIVADVVRDWARRHGSPIDLHLSGPAGGVFSSRGTRSNRSEHLQRIEQDAVAVMRTLSGRAPGEGALAVSVPF